MTRDQVTSIFPDATSEQLDKLLGINGADIEKVKKAGEKTAADLSAATEKLKEYQQQLERLEKTVQESESRSEESKKLREEYEAFKKQIAEKEAKALKDAEDAELTNSILTAIGEKEFTSEYVKNGLIADMKQEIAKPENKGKGYDKLFEALTKDKEGIFKNPNPPANIPGTNPQVQVPAERDQYLMRKYGNNAYFQKQGG